MFLNKFLLIFMYIFISIFSFAKQEIENKWKLKKDIFLTGENKYKKIYLDKEIYRYSKNNLSDLRIYNSKNKEVPYYIIKSVYSEHINTNIYSAEKINDYMDKTSRILEFKINSVEYDKDVLINSIIVHIPSKEFYKEISIFGSYDNLRWEHILNTHVYSVNHNISNEINFNQSFKYKYYKFEIKKNIEFINFNSITPQYKKSNKYIYEFTKKYSAKYDINNDNSKTIIKIPNNNKLNFQSIFIKTKGNFKRKFSLYGYKINNNTKEIISSGKIFSMNFQNNLINKTNIPIKQNTSSFNELVIEIENNSDMAIDIQEIELTYYFDKLVFQAKKEESYSLFIGNEKLKTPKYDIIEFKKQIENEKQDLLKFSNTTIFENSKKKSNINLKLIFNILLVLIIIMINLIIITTLKKKIK